MGLLPYFPLANGFLTGKFSRGSEPRPDSRLGKVKFLADRYMTPEAWDALDGLEALARHHSRSVLDRSEEHTSELQSLMRISYAVFCLTKKQQHTRNTAIT